MCGCLVVCRSFEEGFTKCTPGARQFTALHQCLNHPPPVAATALLPVAKVRDDQALLPMN